VNNYRIEKHDSKYYIIENSTDHYIMEHVEQDVARKELRRLNFGSFFEGWTPNFFLKNSLSDQEKTGSPV